MIAIALVLVLIVGVAQVFQMTSQTVSAGQALSALTRDARAAETTMTADVGSMVTAAEQPAIILFSTRSYAFLNENEEAADRDGLPWTVDHNGDGVEGNAPGELIHPAYYGARNHRIDMLSFFANGLFRRQTGADNQDLVTDGRSTEAWINYGHLIVPRYPEFAGAADPRLSALANSPDRFRIPPSWVSLDDSARLRSYGQQYARNWILGRSVTLLKSPSPPADPNDAAARDDYLRQMRGLYVSDGPLLAPLRPTSPGVVDATAANPQIAQFDGRDARLFTSRFDLARTNIPLMLSDVQSSGDPKWYRNALLFRFEGDPTPDPAGGYDPADIARTTPIFLRNCTGFVVEYAGDFLGQYDKKEHEADAAGNQPQYWGAPNRVYKSRHGTDGRIDFLYDPPKDLNGVKKIRWYGLPRDTGGSTSLTGAAGPGRSLGGDGTINSIDVFPLRDFWDFARAGMIASGEPDPGPCPFEKDPADVFPNLSGPRVATMPNEPASGLGYLDPELGLRDRDYGKALGSSSHPSDDAYLCVWEPGERKPSLIRITLFMNDPNNRLPEGQVYQYVLRVPGS